MKSVNSEIVVEEKMPAVIILFSKQEMMNIRLIYYEMKKEKNLGNT
jgi:hypothetical protein